MDRHGIFPGIYTTDSAHIRAPLILSRTRTFILALGKIELVAQGQCESAACLPVEGQHPVAAVDS